MRQEIHPRLEAGRIYPAGYKSYGYNGAFVVQGPCGEQLRIVSSDATDPLSVGWEHVSVSTRRRVPNWMEMSFVKDLFWGEEDCVVQFHPPKSEYVNNHPFVLHLWRHINQPFPMPPPWMVGVKGEEYKTAVEALEGERRAKERGELP